MNSFIEHIAVAADLNFEEINELNTFLKGNATSDFSEQLFGKLYEYFLMSGDMPYGTAKARTGDPHQWIDERLLDML